MKYNLVILLATAATNSYAQGSLPSQSVAPPQILICKLVQDSAMRLSCYDNAVSVLSLQPSPSTSAVKERSWEITEQTDEPRSISGTLIGEKTGTLVLRCRGNRTEVSVDFGSALKPNNDRVRIVYRINDAKDVEGHWNVSQNAKDASPPKPISFVRSLPNDGTLSIQAVNDHNLLSTETFKLGEMSELKAKLGSLCQWPEPLTSAQKRSIPLPRSSPIRVNQDGPQKQNTLPSWLSNILK